MDGNFYNFYPQNSRRLVHDTDFDTILNFGPQHPASHGVLRVLLKVRGEHIIYLDSHVGFLHRGTEKLMEARTFLKSLPYFDRLDYVSMMTQEHAFCLGIEQILCTQSYTANYIQIRVLFDELTRILNHLLALSTHSLDVGNMSPVFWAFEERERIMEFYERVSGARMHAAFYRPNEMDWTGLNSEFFLDLTSFLRNSLKSLTEIFSVLVTNRIWKSRLVRIGALDSAALISYGATGPVARGGGLRRDVRLARTFSYSHYWYLSFSSFLGKRGDAYDRFLIRIREMFESVAICFQILTNVSYSDAGFWRIPTLPLHRTTASTKYQTMEGLIEHFKTYSDGVRLPRAQTYASVEAPKGEFGVSLFSNNTTRPFRCKIRTPAYHHMNTMTPMTEGHYFADLVTILGSQDIVFGDVDR